MSFACHRTRSWLQQTLRSWLLYTACRSVSTTSAINRGLRATKVLQSGRRLQAKSDQQPDQAITRRHREHPKLKLNGSKDLTSRNPRSFQAAASANATSSRSERRPGIIGRERRLIPAYPAPQRAAVQVSRSRGGSRDAPRAKARPAQTVTKTTVNQPNADADTYRKSPFEKAANVPEALPANISFPLRLIKSSLAHLQHAERLPDGEGSQLPSVPLAQVREVLRDLNRNYQSELWTSKDLHRALKATLGPEQWGWRRDGSPTPRVWFNRPDKTLELIFKDGSSDPRVLDRGGQRPAKIPCDSLVISSSPHGETPGSQYSAKGDSNQASDVRRDKAAIKPRRYERIAKEQEEETPLFLPYTTAASVFLYGSNTVYAALKAKRRQLYKLHLYKRFKSREKHSLTIPRMATAAGVEIVTHQSTMLLDKMSQDRPHNGFVLEASTIPAPPTLSLDKPLRSTGAIRLNLETQSTEDAAINGRAGTISASMKERRHPFVVMLDGILDPGNVGSILRTCYFYGVDAVAIATNTCANLNSAALAKASSGACEAIPILALPRPGAFVWDSAKAGWRVFAAVAPPASSDDADGVSAKGAKKYATASSLAATPPLSEGPCLLMLGAEGEGLRESLKSKAECFVCIESGRDGSDGLDVDVDSLNVSVATSVLLESFLRPALAGEKQVQLGTLGF